MTAPSKGNGYATDRRRRRTNAEIMSTRKTVTARGRHVVHPEALTTGAGVDELGMEEQARHELTRTRGESEERGIGRRKQGSENHIPWPEDVDREQLASQHTVHLGSPGRYGAREGDAYVRGGKSHRGHLRVRRDLSVIRTRRRPIAG
jgi:hypothetical protein